MDWEYYKPYMKKKTRGKNRADSTTLFTEREVFHNLVSDLAEKIKHLDFSKIACIDALGFVLGGALAFKLNKGLITVRKGGKLPLNEEDLIRERIQDYSDKEDSLEINKNTVKPGDKIVLVDNWIMTGTQMNAAIRLIEKAGGIIAGVSCIGIEKNEKDYAELDYKVYPIVEIRD